MGGPALVSHSLIRHPLATETKSPFSWMGTPRAALITKLLAAGELVGDKLPMAPDRIAPGPLFGRVLSGALCGATLYAAGGNRIRIGALLGAVSAVAGAYGFYYLRHSVGQKFKVPDAMLGAAEDALVFGAGWLTVTK